jgi:hypothetical protein
MFVSTRVGRDKPGTATRAFASRAALAWSRGNTCIERGREDVEEEVKEEEVKEELEYQGTPLQPNPVCVSTKLPRSPIKVCAGCCCP